MCLKTWMEASFGRFYLVLQCFADGFNILSLCTDLFRKKKSKPTTKQRANKQNQPNKQEKTLTNFFLPRCRFFLFMFCRRLIFGRIMSAACFRCCLAEIKILLSRRLWVYKCSLSMQIMSGKTWFFWAFLLIDNHTTYAGCVMPNDGCLGMTSVMSVKVLFGMHKPFKYTL